LQRRNISQSLVGVYPQWVPPSPGIETAPLVVILRAMHEPQELLSRTDVVRRWARHSRCVRLARAHLGQVLADWRVSGIEDAALLVLSELLTNAVRHARTSPGREIETRYVWSNEGLRIEVHDAADEYPEQRAADVDEDHGRGLALVAALADRWGVSPRVGVGKSVWAVMSVPDRGGDAIMTSRRSD
jgi:serine/threonine-protein kinase RsbW